MSDSAWSDVGDGKPVKVKKCSLCGIAPANVDDCGEFGNPKCPCFGIKKDNIMTTELKPCPFCNRTKHLMVDDYHDPEMDGYFGFTVICNAAGWDGVDKGCGASGAWGEAKEEAINIWNTRAVPDVPELMTIGYADAGTINLMMHYHVKSASLAPTAGGNFDEPVVFHSQAAAIIATERQRAEAAEAKLAEYEKQKPVAWCLELSDAEGHCTYSNKPADGWKHLYASPAPMEEK